MLQMHRPHLRNSMDILFFKVARRLWEQVAAGSNPVTWSIFLRKTA